MEDIHIYQTPPPFDPEWLEYEKTSGILSRPVITDLKARQVSFSQRRKEQNKILLSGRDKYLAEGIHIRNITVEGKDPQDIYPITVRVYNPIPSSAEPKNPLLEGQPLVIYYHGGGLRVGDLDWSSSGGQLAATVAQAKVGATDYERIHGLLLRCPVTSEPTTIPERFRRLHTSMSPAFNSSLCSFPGVVTESNRARTLPLESKDLSEQPRTWMQVTTNDIYYSDGICYAKALKDSAVEVKVDVVKGWPHTFWLDAPLLERAAQADNDMIAGLKWLFDSDLQ
ncbi:hypothetical protein B7463_g5163, partial [Scytalidium lignicola]